MKEKYFIAEIEGFKHRIMVELNSVGQPLTGRSGTLMGQGIWGTENIKQPQLSEVYKSIASYLYNLNSLVVPNGVDDLYEESP